jgi:hypothetical protein
MSKYPRELPLSRPTSIYNPPQKIEPLQTRRGTLRTDRTRRSDRPDATLASGRYCPSEPMPATRPYLDIERRFPTVTS